MAKERKADALAKGGGIADKLRRRRMAAESYDTGEDVSSEMADAKEMKPTADDYRGYTKENWDES